MTYRESLIELLRTVSPLKRVAEIGVHRGRTSRLLLKELRITKLYMVDSWAEWKHGERQETPERQEAFYRKALDATEGFKNRRFVIRATSVEALEIVPMCDAVFIDGDHSEEGVRQDMPWWDKVRPGGIFCGHDFANHDFPGVELAVREFAERNELELNLAEGNIWWFRKS